MTIKTAVAKAKDFLLQPGQTLSQRVVRGGFWVFALRIVSRGLSLVRTIVLARVLAPEDFGLMGIALLAMSTLETFSQTGFQAALIQKQENIDDYLDTAWTISALRGVVLFILLYLAAPLIARFFDTPAATPIMRVISISELLKGFTNVGVVYFRKELEFDKQFIYQLSGTLADLGVAVTAALLLQSVWALVFGLLARNLIGFAVSYVVHPYRPRLRLERARVKELYSFGRWVLGSSILVFLLMQGDDILAGKLLGTTALGLYQMAYKISNMPATEVSHVISQVTFPTYSKLQNNLPKLRGAYLKTLQLTAFVSIPLAGGILVFAPDFTRLFLGEKWMRMVPVMQVLAIWGALRSIAKVSDVAQAIGRPQIGTKLSFIQLLMLAGSVYPLSIRFGVLGTACAVLVAGLGARVLSTFIVARLLNLGVKKLLTNVAFPAVATAFASLALILLRRGLGASVTTLSLLGYSATGMLVYISIALLLEKYVNYQLVSFLKHFWYILKR